MRGRRRCFRRLGVYLGTSVLFFFVVCVFCFVWVVCLDVLFIDVVLDLCAFVGGLWFGGWVFDGVHLSLNWRCFVLLWGFGFVLGRLFNVGFSV